MNFFISKCQNPPRQNKVILVMVSGRKAWLLDLFHDPLQTFLSSSKTLHDTEQSMRTHLSMSMLKVQASWDSSRSIFFS